MKRIHAAAITVGLTTWAIAIAAGQCWLLRYERTAGSAGGPPSALSTNDLVPSAEAAISRPFRLLAFVHPHCPCTSATLAELAEFFLAARDKVVVDIYVADFQIPDSPVEDSPNWIAANQLHANLHVDRSAKVARSYGCATSGQIVVYRPDGSLVFSGGITSGRGMTGENAGSEMLRRLVSTTEADRAEKEVMRTEVFGCPIYDSSNSNGEGN